MNRTLISMLALFALALSAGAQSYPPAWSSSASYAIGDQVQLNGNVLRATHAVAPGSFKYGDWELWEVRSNSTYLVGVGQTFTSLASAWTYVQNARIADGAYVHLYISSAHGNFSESFVTPFNLDHGSGAKVSILGDSIANDVLTFHSSNGFVIDSGHIFGTLSGFTLAENTPNGFYYGIEALRNSTLPAVQNVGLTGFNDGINAFTGASITVSQETITGLQTGLVTGQGGIIVAESITVKNCLVGAYADQNSTMDVSYSSFSSCSTGVEAWTGAFINAQGTTYSSINSNAIQASQGAHILATNTAQGIVIQTGQNDGSYVYTT